MSQQKMRTGAWANILPFTIMSALTSHWAIGHRLKFIIWKEVKKNQGKSTKPRLRNYVLTLGKNGLDKGVNLTPGNRNLASRAKAASLAAVSDLNAYEAKPPRYWGLVISAPWAN